MDTQTQTELDAATFRRLVEHFQTHTDVQNIDLMNLADFCRNCLAKWYMAAAADRGLEIDYDQARQYIYGMPYSEWKGLYQKESTSEQLAEFEAGEARRKAESS